MSLIKFAVYTIGGAAGLATATAFGGIGIVAGGAAIGLTALEVAVVGGASGATIYTIREDQRAARAARLKAQAAEKAARREQRKASFERHDLKVKAEKARAALDELEV